MFEIKFACKSMQVFHCLATQPKSMEANDIIEVSALKWVFCDLRVLVGNFPVCLATQRRSLHKFNYLQLLASPFGQGFIHVAEF